MIADSKDNLFSIVIVHKLDRFARNRYDSATYKKKLKDNGVIVKSVLENLDNSPEAIILESVLEGMSEYYSKNLAREVRKGQTENALKAKHNGGIPPLGYDLDHDKNYVINETEAIAVKKIFEMYADNYGYSLIASGLNQEGYKTKHGNNFSKHSIYDILINEKYRGCYVWNKRKSKRCGNHQYKEDKDIVRIENALPRIVSDELFFQVQNKLGTRLKPRKATAYNYLLTGYIKCGLCGYSFCGGQTYKLKDGTRVYRYSCTGRKNHNECKCIGINAQKIEKIVIDKIKETFLTPEAIEIIASDLSTLISEMNSSAISSHLTLKKEIDVIQNKINKLLDLFLDDKIDKLTLETKNNTLNSQLSSLQHEYANSLIQSTISFDVDE